MILPVSQGEQPADGLPARWARKLAVPSRAGRVAQAPREKIALSYARNSSVNPYNGSSEESVERQHQYNAATALEYDLGRLVEFEDRAMTGRTANRTGLSQAVAFARQHSGFQISLLLEDADRLSRDMPTWVKIQVELDELGVSVYDLSGPVEPEELAERAAAASRDVKKLLRRTRLHKLKSMIKGRYLTSPPWGYRRVRRAVIEPDDAKAKLVEGLFQRSAQGSSLSELSRWLNEMREQPPRVRRGDWHLSTIREILLNPLYSGWTRNRLPRPLPAHMESLLIQAEGEDLKIARNAEGAIVGFLVRTDWTTIVPETVFLASADNLERHATEAMAKRIGRSGVRRHFVLTHLAFCPGCGEPLRISSNTRGERTLICKSTPASRCDVTVSFMLRDIERFAVEGLTRILARKIEYAEDYQRKLEEQAVDRAEAIAAARKEGRSALKRMERDFKRRDQTYPANPELRAEHERISLDLLHRIKALRAELSEDAPAPPVRLDLSGLMGLLPLLEGIWKRAPLVASTAAERAVRDAMRSVIARVDFEKQSRFRSKVKVSYDFGRALGVDDPNLRETVEFEHDGLADPARRRQASGDLIRTGRLALSESEFRLLEDLDGVKHCSRNRDRELMRGVLDALVHVALLDVDFGTACRALEVDPTTAYTVAGELRRSEALRAFKKTLAEMRPEADWALGKLDIKPRIGRLLRTRLGVDNPVLRLPHCSKSTHRPISDSEWEAVLPALPPGLRANPETVRRDLDAVFHVVSHGLAWASLPRSLGGGSNTPSRFRNMILNGTFAKAVGVLLHVNGLSDSLELALPRLRPKA